MIFEGLHYEIFNKNEYVLVMTFDYKGKRLYYFVSQTDSLICYKKDGEYVPITNKDQLWLIKNACGLVDINKKKFITALGATRKLASNIRLAPSRGSRYSLKFRRLSPEEEQAIKQEQKENFRAMQEKFELDIDQEHSDSIIDSLKFYEASRLGRADGFYAPVFHSVVLKKDLDPEKAKKVRTHEGIHAHTGLLSAMYGLYFSKGILEGQTESLAAAFHGDKESCLDSSQVGEIVYGQKYNFPQSTAYKKNVCLVRQMEAAIGRKSHSSILKGNLDFEIEFAKRYGIGAYLYMAARSDLMTKEDMLDLGINTGQMFEKTQNKLLRIVFDRDFRDIKTPEDATAYFKKLRRFDKVRARTSTFNLRTKQKTVDTTYQEYYQEKYGQVRDLLAQRGYTPEQILEAMQGMEYKEQKFHEMHNPLEVAKDSMARIIALQTLQQGRQNLDDYRLVKMTSPDGPITYYTVKGDDAFSIGRALNPEKGKAEEMLIRLGDFERTREIGQENGSTFTDVTSTLDRNQMKKQIAERVDELKKQREEERRAEKGDKSLVPDKSTNIFRRILNTIKEAFMSKKPREPEAEPVREEKKRDDPEEEVIPSWDMRNYSEAEQERAKSGPNLEESSKSERPEEPQELEEDEGFGPPRRRF